MNPGDVEGILTHLTDSASQHRNAPAIALWIESFTEERILLNEDGRALIGQDLPTPAEVRASLFGSTTDTAPRPR